MTVFERLPQAPETLLSDKELEVLRLLTAGHTVKSIALQLGRSEASINERLRDARRKTGASSSRELARLLDARKIWDKNIDLAPDQHPADQDLPPAQRRRTWSKGTKIMLFALPVAAAGLITMAAGSLHPVATGPAAITAVSSQSPLVGTWSLDVGRIPAAERPRRVTIRFGVTPDGKWATHVEVVAPDGSAVQADSVAAPDGVAVSGTGNMPNIDSVSLRQPAPNTLVMTLGKNGAPVSTRVYTVAKDRKSMTETIIWAGGDMPRLETTYFNRIG